MSTMFPEVTAQATTEAQAATTEEIDLSEVQTVENADTDYNIVPPPPPAGRYTWKLSLHEDGISPRKSTKVGTFLVIPLVLNLVAEGTPYHDYQVRDWVNNIYNKMKGTTKAHWILHCLGETVPVKISHQDLKSKLESVLSQHPLISADMEWQASIKDPSDKRANEAGYVTIKNRMKDFPQNPDGSFSNVFESKVDGTKVYAQAYILDTGYHKG